jgi:hypothetical protein
MLRPSALQALLLRSVCCLVRCPLQNTASCYGSRPWQSKKGVCSGLITEMNRMCLFDMNDRIFGPYLTLYDSHA